jgi:hypothetical protein
MTDWHGVMPEQWPKCRQHGLYLKPSIRYVAAGGIVFVCTALDDPRVSSPGCKYTIVVALYGLPPDLAGAYRLGGVEGFANVLGVEVHE